VKGADIPIKRSKGEWMTKMDKKTYDLLQKQHKELITVLIQIGHQSQELRKLLQNFYNDYLVYNQKELKDEVKM